MNKENNQSGTDNAPEKNGQTFGEWFGAELQRLMANYVAEHPDYKGDALENNIISGLIEPSATLLHEWPQFKTVRGGLGKWQAIIDDKDFEEDNPKLAYALWALQAVIETKMKLGKGGGVKIAIIDGEIKRAMDERPLAEDFLPDVPPLKKEAIPDIFTMPIGTIYGVKQTGAADPESGNEATPADHRPVMAQLVPEQAALLTKAADHSAAERAAASIDEIKGKMLALWRRWLYDEPYKPERTRETPPAEKKLCAAMNDAVFAYWKAFQNGELDGTLSVQEHDKYIVERKHKRSANEFWTTHGADVVYRAQDGKQYTLQELCPTVEDVQRMIDRNNKSIRRAEQKNGQSADKKKI